MRILIAPDKFKGSLKAKAFCNAAEKAIYRYAPTATVHSLPLSDGGEGFCEAMLLTGNYHWEHVMVSDPLFRDIQAGYLANTGHTEVVIELSAASGLQLLVPGERNCMFTSSIGTGQLVEIAIHRGAKHVILGLGGSAMNDGGVGFASALGYRFLNKAGEKIKPTGENLTLIHDIEKPPDPAHRKVRFTVLSDVRNVLCGPKGAAYSFAAQKGAGPEEVEQLDLGLKNLAKHYEKHFGINPINIPGSGAAGGMGAVCLSILGTELRSGAKFLLEKLEFEKKCRSVDLVITGEGQLDKQSLNGKLPFEVAKVASKYVKPVLMIVGQVEAGFQPPQIFNTVIEISKRAGSVQKAVNNPATYVGKIIYEYLSESNNQAWID